MSKRPWYKRFPSDFIAGTIMLTAEEKGVYSTIIDLLNDRGGPIDDNSADLARICGCGSAKRFQSIKLRLVNLGKLALVGGRITNARFERDRKNLPIGIDSEPENSGSDSGLLNGLDAPLSYIPEPKVKKTKGARERMPEDFELSVALVSNAAAKGFSPAKIESMFEAFCNHHRSRGNEMADWPAAWRTWVGNEIKFRGVPGNEPKPTGGDRPHSASGPAPSGADAILTAMGRVASRIGRQEPPAGPGHRHIR